VTDEEYKIFRKANPSFHETVEYQRTRSQIQKRQSKPGDEEEFERRSDALSYIDFALNYLYREGGTKNAEGFLYFALHYWRFHTWPAMWTGPFKNHGALNREFINDSALEKLHIVYHQMTNNGVVDGHALRLTIHDYPGFKEMDGKRVSFANFCKRVKEGRYKSLWKKFLREKGTTVHFEETPEARTVYGGISEGHAVMEMAAPGEDAVFASGYVLGSFQKVLDEIQREYEREYPEIAHADLRLGIKSASKIARMVKGGELDYVRDLLCCDEQQQSPRAPYDRERVSSIMQTFRSRARQVMGQAVRDRQARLIEAKALEPVQALNLDDPRVLDREITRILGGFEKPAKTGPNYSSNGQYKAPELTRDQTLGWGAYKIGGNADDAEKYYGEHGDFAASRSHDTGYSRASDAGGETGRLMRRAESADDV
jgi:hypothetical protein